MRDQSEFAPDLSDAEAGSADGPPDGLMAVYAQNRHALLRFLCARTRDADLAQDLCQELWLRIARAAPGPLGNPRAYLFQAANRLALDHARGAWRRSMRDGEWLAGEDGALHAPDLRPDPAPGADDALIAAQEAALLARAIAQLPPGAARALTLHKIDGLTHSQVAAHMGISRSGVEKHMAVAMKHLRAALADCGAGARAASHPSEAPEMLPLAGDDHGR